MTRICAITLMTGNAIARLVDMPIFALYVMPTIIVLMHATKRKLTLPIMVINDYNWLLPLLKSIF